MNQFDEIGRISPKLPNLSNLPKSPKSLMFTHLVSIPMDEPIENDEIGRISPKLPNLSNSQKKANVHPCGINTSG